MPTLMKGWFDVANFLPQILLSNLPSLIPAPLLQSISKDITPLVKEWKTTYEYIKQCIDAKDIEQLYIIIYVIDIYIKMFNTYIKQLEPFITTIPFAMEDASIQNIATYIQTTLGMHTQIMKLVQMN
jgi:hypothetical protein